MIERAAAILICSCLNSTLESTGLFWRRKLGLPEGMYGPFPEY